MRFVRAITAAAACAAILGACGGELDADAVDRQVRALASLSAEAAFLAGEARAGHLTRAFVAAHAGNLQRDCGDARAQLARAAPRELAARREAAQALAVQLQSTLQRIGAAPAAPAPEDEQFAAQLHVRFDALRSRT